MATHLPDLRLQLAATVLDEELNFTRASERLHITQPALSKQIAELEVKLGFTAFVRQQRRVVVTDAGQVFVKGCRDSQAVLEKAMRLARAAHDDVEPVLSVGHGPYIDPFLVRYLLSVHLPLYPQLRLHMETMFAPELAQSVTSAELDFAIIPEPSENPSLTLVEIARTPLYCAVPADSPFVRRDAISFSELNGLGWMLFPRRVHPAMYDRIIETARIVGASPAEVHHYVNPNECLQLILGNFGVAILSKGSAEQLPPSEVAIRPFSDPQLVITNYLVLRADQSSQLVNSFCRSFLRKIRPDNALPLGQLSLGL